MKIPRAAFKNIIKEAIKELINEGAIDFSSVVREVVSESSLQGKNNLNEATISRAESVKNGLIKNLKLEKQAMEIAMMSTRDDGQRKIYENIFLDTANTTLQEQLAAEGGMSIEPTPQQIAKDESDLESLGDVSKWASMAFSSVKKRH